jgi:hypothetical protein
MPLGSSKFFNNKIRYGSGIPFEPVVNATLNLTGNDLLEAYDNTVRIGDKVTRNYKTISVDVTTNVPNATLCLDIEGAVDGDFTTSDAHVFFTTDANGNATVTRTLNMDTTYGDKEIKPTIKIAPGGDTLASTSNLFVFAVEGPNISIPGSSNTIITTQNGIDDITYKGINHTITSTGNTTMTLNSIGAQSVNVIDYVFNTNGTGNNKSYYSSTSNVYTMVECNTYVGNATTGVGDQIVFKVDPNFGNDTFGTGTNIKFENIPAELNHLDGITFYIIKVPASADRYQIYTNRGASIKLYSDDIANVSVPDMKGNSDSTNFITTYGGTGVNQVATGMLKLLVIGGGGAGNVAGGGAGQGIMHNYSLSNLTLNTPYVMTVGDGGNTSIIGEGTPTPSNASNYFGAGNNTIAFNGAGSLSISAIGGGAGDITQGGSIPGGNYAGLNAGPTPSTNGYQGYDHEGNFITAAGQIWGAAGRGRGGQSTSVRVASLGQSAIIPVSGPGSALANSKILYGAWDIHPSLDLDDGTEFAFSGGGAGSGLATSQFATDWGVTSRYPSSSNATVCPGTGLFGGGNGYAQGSYEGNTNVLPPASNCSIFTGDNGTDGTGGGGGGTLFSRNETTEGGSGRIEVRYPYATFRFLATSNIA